MRLDAWDTRLARLIDSCRGRVHAYGEFDCCLFVGEALGAQTGKDPVARFRGTYHDEAGADGVLRALSRDGTLFGAALALAVEMRMRRVRTPHAGRGSPAYVSTSDLSARLGIIWGDRVLVAARPAGLARLPIAAAKTAWVFS